MSEKDVLYAQAILGRDALDFINSELGRTMVGIAEQEVAEAMDALKTVSTWRRRKIQELQARVWRAESFQAWLIDLAHAGESAEQALSAPETDD
jgi:hypothetical protein